MRGKWNSLTNSRLKFSHGTDEALLRAFTKCIVLRVRSRTKHQAPRAETLRTKTLKKKMRGTTPSNTGTQKLPWRIPGKRGFYARLVGSLSAGGQVMLQAASGAKEIFGRQDSKNLPSNKGANKLPLARFALYTLWAARQREARHNKIFIFSDLLHKRCTYSIRFIHL